MEIYCVICVPLRLSAAQTLAGFRAIKSAFQEDGIHIGGKVIALIPANSDRAIEAVARLQTETKSLESADIPPSARIAALEKRAGRVVAELMDIAEAGPGQKDRRALLGAVETLKGLLVRIQVKTQ